MDRMTESQIIGLVTLVNKKIDRYAAHAWRDGRYLWLSFPSLVRAAGWIETWDLQHDASFECPSMVMGSPVRIRILLDAVNRKLVA